MGIINQISKLHLVKQKKATKTLNMKEETKNKIMCNVFNSEVDTLRLDYI